MTNQNSFAYLEAKGLSKVWQAYANYFSNEIIIESGFNPNSGYVYLALDNGVQIASAFGQDVEFITYDFDQIEELFFDSYEKLNQYLLQEN
jgi:hypothetical protein